VTTRVMSYDVMVTYGESDAYDHEFILLNSTVW